MAKVNEAEQGVGERKEVAKGLKRVLVAQLRSALALVVHGSAVVRDAVVEFTERFVPAVAVEPEGFLGQTGMADPYQRGRAGWLERELDRARAGWENRRSLFGPPPG